MERLKRQKEIELDALHPRDREKLERAGARGRKVGSRVQGAIDRRAVVGEKIVKERIKDSWNRLLDGNKFTKRRQKK